MTISLFTKCLFEFIGTALLILLGDGVVASSLLKHSKGFGGGWVVIIGLALAHTFPWAYVPAYIIAQLAGGFLGAVLVYVFYKDHYDATEDPDVKLGTFCTMPAIRNIPRNLICEVIGTFVLVFVILCLAIDGNTPEVGLGSVGLFPVTFLIVAIGMSLGGATGYAINPARDLPPRFAHFVLPIRGKGSSGWGYSWVPVLGPILGACLAAGCYKIIFP